MKPQPLTRFNRIALVALLFTLFLPLSLFADTKPIRALLVIGGCCHDYEQQQRILTEGISARANVEWTIVHEGDGSTAHKMSVYENSNWSKGYDVVVHDECCADVKDRDFVENILKPHRAGLPAVNLHCAMHCYRVDFDKFKDWFEFTGLDTRAHGAQLPIALDFVPKPHPITQGMSNWTTIPEELYNNLQIWPTTSPLIYGAQGDNKTMVAWVNDYHGTRVFSTTLGHNDEIVSDARYLDLVTRGLLWSVNKLNAKYLKPAKRVLLPVKPGKKVMAPENLALNKPATASNSQAGNDPAHAVDGLRDTRWCAMDNASGYWWQVDLLKTESITGCKIIWEKSAAYQYRIEGSADAKNWQTLVEEKTGAARPETDIQKFDASNIRYVRITITHAPDGCWASFFEFEVWGKKMVSKLAQNDNLSGVKVPAGFEATYFAGPLDVSYPTCIAAAPTGEVFIGVDQNGSLDTAANRGWVVRCRDTHGTGVADQFNIFAKMDSPRGIVFDHNTLYVMHPPVLEAFYDDKGVGTANRSEVLVRGLGHDLKFRGADHTCNGVRLGIDGWLYIALGDYGAQKAVGKDGKEIQMHGGGIVRVRPDGSDLEIVVQGTRNIYDVAIDPFMDIFTCDNTNDGDDWNVRLSHMIATANYGYPSLFRNFPDEMMPTMVDYGGGAPTGAIFLDEPGFPGDFGHGLYACQWGWNNVTRHPLQQDGATFKTIAKESPFELPRPTGIDADGEGNLYIASWKNAVFTYNGPYAGFVLKAHSKEAHLPKFPNLQKTSDKDLLKYLTSPSAIWRLNISREILRRAKLSPVTPKFSILEQGVYRLATESTNLEVQAAAIFTLAQLPSFQTATNRFSLKPILSGAHAPYGMLPQEFLIRALADNHLDALQRLLSPKQPDYVFTNFVADSNPRIRLQAVIALNRFKMTNAASQILPLLADKDIGVAHAAFRALVDMNAYAVCFGVIDRHNAALIPGVMRVLRNLHEPAVVDGLIARLDKTKDTTHDEVLKDLCRLYYHEGDYDGSWWGTRPDTSGPYFKPATWDQSEKIKTTLLAEISKADTATLLPLLAQLKMNKIDFPEISTALRARNDNDPKLLAAENSFIKSPSREKKSGVLTLSNEHEVSHSANIVLPAVPSKDQIVNIPYAEVVRVVLQTPGDARFGAQLFEALSCIKCHTTTKSEPLKGPFLGDITARYSQPEIIESILKPNAQIAQGFITTTIETKDGSEYDGFIVRESGDQVELRNLAGVNVIPIKDIVKRGTRPTSIMPEGLLDQRTPADLASLLTYLQSLKPKP